MLSESEHRPALLSTGDGDFFSDALKRFASPTAYGGGGAARQSRGSSPVPRAQLVSSSRLANAKKARPPQRPGRANGQQHSVSANSSFANGHHSTGTSSHANSIHGTSNHGHGLAHEEGSSHEKVEKVDKDGMLHLQLLRGLHSVWKGDVIVSTGDVSTGGGERQSEAGSHSSASSVSASLPIPTHERLALQVQMVGLGLGLGVGKTRLHPLCPPRFPSQRTIAWRCRCGYGYGWG